jgi:hypothetical protein
VARDALTAEAVKRENSARAARGLAQIKTGITTWLDQQAPDVDQEVFWAWAAPTATRECPATLTDPAERVAWQAQRAVALMRERGLSRPRPGGPNRPTAGAPARQGDGRGRTMADVIWARQRRVLPWARGGEP